jgi:hypothetical protein
MGKTTGNMPGYPSDTMSMMTGMDQDKKVKELEKKITKMRNEKYLANMSNTLVSN